MECVQVVVFFCTLFAPGVVTVSATVLQPSADIEDSRSSHPRSSRQFPKRSHTEDRIPSSHATISVAGDVEVDPPSSSSVPSSMGHAFTVDAYGVVGALAESESSAAVRRQSRAGVARTKANERTDVSRSRAGDALSRLIRSLSMSKDASTLEIGKFGPNDLMSEINSEEFRHALMILPILMIVCCCCCWFRSSRSTEDESSQQDSNVASSADADTADNTTERSVDAAGASAPLTQSAEGKTRGEASDQTLHGKTVTDTAATKAMERSSFSAGAAGTALTSSQKKQAGEGIPGTALTSSQTKQAGEGTAGTLLASSQAKHAGEDSGLDKAGGSAVMESGGSLQETGNAATSLASDGSREQTGVDGGRGQARGSAATVSTFFSSAVQNRSGSLSVGNSVIDRSGLDNDSEVHFVDTAAKFPFSASILTFGFFAGRASQAGLKLQVYRRTSGNEYRLIDETVAFPVPSAGHQTFDLPSPLKVQIGDYVGWAHIGQGVVCYDDGGHEVRWKQGLERVGDSINFANRVIRTYSYGMEVQTLVDNDADASSDGTSNSSEGSPDRKGRRRRGGPRNIRARPYKQRTSVIEKRKKQLEEEHEAAERAAEAAEEAT